MNPRDCLWDILNKGNFGISVKIEMLFNQINLFNKQPSYMSAANKCPM